MRRDKVLEAALEHIPELYPFVNSCYSGTSNLLFDNSILLSQEGVQQGDPLGPLLLSLVILPLVKKLGAGLRILYLDDGLIGGTTSAIMEDIRLIQRKAVVFGLHLNLNKSKLICQDHQESGLLQSTELYLVEPRDSTFLGAPIGPLASVDSVMSKKIDALSVMVHSTISKDLCALSSSLFLCHPQSLVLVEIITMFNSCLPSYRILLAFCTLRTLTAVLNINLSDDCRLGMMA